MRKEATENVNKRKGSNASLGSQKSDLSIISTHSVGIQAEINVLDPGPLN